MTLTADALDQIYSDLAALRSKVREDEEMSDFPDVREIVLRRRAEAAEAQVAVLREALTAAHAMQAVLTVLREAEQLHTPDMAGLSRARCEACNVPWPCDTRQALDTIGGGE